MAVGQTTINNQLIVAVATATETMTMKAAMLTALTLAAATGHLRGQRSGGGGNSSDGNIHGATVARWVERRQRGSGGRIALAPRGGGRGGGGSVDYLACGGGGSSCGGSMIK